jgi:hypothetical protein
MNNYEDVYNIGLLDDIHFLFPELLYDNVLFPNSEMNNILGWMRYKLTRLYPNIFHRNRLAYLRNRATNVRNDYDNWEFLLNRPVILPPMVHRNVIITEPPVVRGTGDGLSDLIRLLLNHTGNFEDPVPVFPSVEQLNNATEIFHRNNQSENSICTICQNGDNSPTEVAWRRIKSCGHTFHRDCIDRWFREHSRCPICRVDIRVGAPMGQTTTNQQTVASEEERSESN